MANVYVNGPSHLFVGTGSSHAPVYLGTSAQGVSIEFRDQFEGVPNDLGGKVEFDATFAGEDAMVSADMTRYNESVYAVISARPSLGTRGVSVPGDIGTLMVQEGVAYPLWILGPYAIKPSFVAMPLAYHFLAAFLLPDSLPNLGTTAKKVHLQWHCLRTFDLTVSNLYGQGAMRLYDTDATAVLGLPIN